MIIKQKMDKRDQMALEFAKIFLAGFSTPRMTLKSRLERFFLGRQGLRIINFGERDIAKHAYIMADEMLKYSKNEHN